MTAGVIVPPEQWASFLELATRKNAGREVRIEVLDPSFGDQEEADGVRLVDVAYDAKDDVVIVSAAEGQKEGRTTLRHLVPRPSGISSALLDDGQEVMRISSAEGSTTLLWLKPASNDASSAPQVRR